MPFLIPRASCLSYRCPFVRAKRVIRDAPRLGHRLFLPLPARLTAEVLPTLAPCSGADKFVSPRPNTGKRTLSAQAVSDRGVREVRFRTPHTPPETIPQGLPHGAAPMNAHELSL